MSLYSPARLRSDSEQARTLSNRALIPSSIRAPRACGTRGGLSGSFDTLVNSRRQAGGRPNCVRVLQRNSDGGRGKGGTGRGKGGIAKTGALRRRAGRTLVLGRRGRLCTTCQCPPSRSGACAGFANARRWIFCPPPLFAACFPQAPAAPAPDARRSACRPPPACAFRRPPPHRPPTPPPPIELLPKLVDVRLGTDRPTPTPPPPIVLPLAPPQSAGPPSTRTANEFPPAAAPHRKSIYSAQSRRELCP